MLSVINSYPSVCMKPFSLLIGKDGVGIVTSGSINVNNSSVYEVNMRLISHFVNMRFMTGLYSSAL